MNPSDVTIVERDGYLRLKFESEEIRTDLSLKTQLPRMIEEAVSWVALKDKLTWAVLAIYWGGEAI